VGLSDSAKEIYPGGRTMKHFTSLPKVKTNDSLLDDDLCLIDGQEQPLIVGQIVEMMSDGEQPRLIFLGDPGHGCTWAISKLAEILHNELNILEGDFKPEKQITQDPLKFSKRTRKNRKKIFIVPDADSVFPSDEHYTPKNKTNRDLMYLTRRFSNLLGYDAHELSRCDKAIRTNHNIKMVSIGDGDTYKFKADKVKRKNDSLTVEIDPQYKGVWKAGKPSKETRQRIEKLDQEEKERKVKKREEQMEMERKKKDLEKLLT